MHIQTQNHSDKVTMMISVDWNDVREEYQTLLKQYGKIPVRGFRAGTVPVKTLESLLRKQLQSDLAHKCSTRLCREALTSEKMESGSPISIQDVDMEQGEKFSFVAEFLLMPEFDLPDYANLNLWSESEEGLLDEISEKLLKLTKLQLNKAFVEQELLFSEEQHSEQAWENAQKRVTLMLILKKIAKQDNIEVDDKDLEARVKEVAAANDVAPEELKEYLLKEGGLSRVGDLLMAEQVLAYIIEINKTNITK